MNALSTPRREEAIRQLRESDPLEALNEEKERERRELLQRVFSASYRHLGGGHYDFAKVFLERALALLRPSGRIGYVLPRLPSARYVVVASVLADKDVEGVVPLLATLADRAYACRSSSPRAAPVERVAAALTAAGLEDIQTFQNVPAAVEAARREAGEDDLILVTGSFYTVADARPLLLGA